MSFYLKKHLTFNGIFDIIKTVENEGHKCNIYRDVVQLGTFATAAGGGRREQ